MREVLVAAAVTLAISSTSQLTAAPQSLSIGANYQGFDVATNPSQELALEVVLSECPGLAAPDVQIRPLRATVISSYGEVGRYGEKDLWANWYEFRFFVEEPPAILPRMWQHQFSVQLSTSPAEISADKSIGEWACNLTSPNGFPAPRSTRVSNWPPEG